jgi:hypothetical protein
MTPAVRNRVEARRALLDAYEESCSTAGAYDRIMQTYILLQDRGFHITKMSEKAKTKHEERHKNS